MPLITSKVQRLDHKPISARHAKVSQVFGGGMMQMSQEQWDMIQQIFDLHYMGAAEYEGGAFPQAITTLLAKRDNYEGWEFTLSAQSIKEGYWRSDLLHGLRRAEIDEARAQNKEPPRLNKKKLEEKAKITARADRTIYVYGSKHLHAEIETLIRAVAADTMWVKCGAGMPAALDPDPKYEQQTVGWFDLDNQVFWFINREMWEDTIKLFSP